MTRRPTVDSRNHRRGRRRRDAALRHPRRLARDLHAGRPNFMAFGSYDPMSNNPLDLQGRVSKHAWSDRHNADAMDTGSL